MKRLAQKYVKKKLAQRRRGAKEESALLDVPSALLFSFSSSLRLCVSARDIFFFCRLRDIAPSDGHYAEAAPRRRLCFRASRVLRSRSSLEARRDGSSSQRAKETPPAVGGRTTRLAGSASREALRGAADRSDGVASDAAGEQSAQVGSAGVGSVKVIDCIP